MTQVVMESPVVNPAFNDSDWRADLDEDDKRWQYGAPQAGNTNFDSVQLR